MRERERERGAAAARSWLEGAYVAYVSIRPHTSAYVRIRAQGAGSKAHTSP